MGYYLFDRYEYEKNSRLLQGILEDMRKRHAIWKKESEERWHNEPDFDFDSQVERWQLSMMNLDNSISDIEEANQEFEQWIASLAILSSGELKTEEDVKSETAKLYKAGREILKTYKCVNSDRKGITYPIRQLESFLLLNLFESSYCTLNIRCKK